MFCSKDFSFRNSDSGIALVEFAAVILVMSVLLASVFEFGRGLETYYRYVQVARDSARLGSWLGNISQSAVCTSQPFPAAHKLSEVDPAQTRTLSGCKPGSTSNGIAEHLLVHDRATALASLMSAWTDLRSLKITTSVVSSSMLKVQLDVDYMPMIPVLLAWSRIPLHVEVTSPLAVSQAGLVMSGSDVSAVGGLYYSRSDDKGIGGPPPPPPPPSTGVAQLSNGMYVGLLATSS